MRRRVTLIPICGILLLTALYLWKVQGVSFVGAERADDGVPHTLDAVHDVPPFDPLETGDFARGVISGAAMTDEIARYALTDPIELFRLSLVKYHETTKAYTCTMCRQERIKGKLNPPDVVECWFKEEPFSVLMHWTQGGGPADASLFIANHHGHKICVRPKIGKVFGYVERSLDAPDVKANSRYSITDFGLRGGAERTYRTWKELRDKGVDLQTEYLGLRPNVEEAGGRACHVIKRHCNPPEEEGLTDVTIYIDAETWQQVGSVLMADDQLIGCYWFKDININPTFDSKQFSIETLKKY